jgi:hypothetical protein
MWINTTPPIHPLGGLIHFGVDILTITAVALTFLFTIRLYTTMQNKKKQKAALYGLGWSIGFVAILNIVSLFLDVMGIPSRF